MTPVKIYALINPITNIVFYIGASKYPKGRLSQHYRTATPKSFANRSLEKRTPPELLILDEVEYEEVRFYEEFYIELFKSWGFKLDQKKTSGYQKNKIRYFPGQIVFIPYQSKYGIVQNIGDVYLDVYIFDTQEIDYFHNKSIKPNYAA